MQSARITFEDWYKSLVLTATVLGVNVNGDLTEVMFTNTYHVRTGMMLMGKKIVSKKDAFTLVFKNLPEDFFVESQIVQLPLPFFWAGSPLGVKQDLAGMIGTEKYPMVYFYEAIKEFIESQIMGGRITANLRLFVLDECNMEAWNNKDHYEIIVNGLRFFIDWLITQVRDHTITCFSQPERISFEVVNRINWGRYSRDGDKTVAWMFDDKLDAIELGFTGTFKCC